MWRLVIFCGIITLSLTGISRGEMLKIEKQIIKHESFRSRAFLGPQGALLVGYGRNLESKGLTKDEALMLLRNDIGECEADLFKIFGKAFSDLDDNRRLALIDMHYTLGPGGFRGFGGMIKAVKQDDWLLAAYEIKNSIWYKQVKGRGKTVYLMMLYGDNMGHETK